MKVKDCIGPRYQGEGWSLGAIHGWHGKFGHLNVVTRDHDSHVTGNGRHDRVVAFDQQRYSDGIIYIYCRIDHLWGLGMPNNEQIVRAAMIENGLKNTRKWMVLRKCQGDKSTDVWLVSREDIQQARKSHATEEN